MKKTEILYFLFVILCCACNKSTRLSADINHITSPKEGFNGKFVCHSDGKVSIDYHPDWMECEIKDSTLCYTIMPLMSSLHRTDSLILTAGNLRYKIEVAQYSDGTYVEVSPTDLAFDVKGGQQMVMVSTDGGIIKVNASESYVKATYDGKAVYVTLEANHGPARSGTIAVMCNEHVAIINYAQEGNACNHCDGRGTITCTYCHGDGKISAAEKGKNINCPQCSNNDEPGSGKIPCPDCQKSTLRNAE